MTNLSLQQLRSLISIIKTGSMAEAARDLCRTQPAISSSIKNLEEQLGIDLFQKQGSKLTPTAEARYLAEQSGVLLSNLESVVKTLDQFKRQQAGTLRIGCLPSASQVVVPELLAKFLGERDGVKVSFLTRTSSTVVNWIEAQQIDIGIAETPLGQSDLYQQYDFKLPCLLATNRRSELASVEELTSEKLSQHPYIGIFPQHEITAGLNRWLREAGYNLNQTVELQTTIPSLQFIKAGLGYSVVDMLSAQSLQMMEIGSELVLRPLPSRISYSLSVLVPNYRDKSILVAAFLDELTKTLTDGHVRLSDSRVPTHEKGLS